MSPRPSRALVQAGHQITDIWVDGIHYRREQNHISDRPLAWEKNDDCSTEARYGECRCRKWIVGGYTPYWDGPDDLCEQHWMTTHQIHSVTACEAFTALYGHTWWQELEYIRWKSERDREELQREWEEAHG